MLDAFLDFLCAAVIFSLYLIVGEMAICYLEKFFETNNLKSNRKAKPKNIVIEDWREVYNQPKSL